MKYLTLILSLCFFSISTSSAQIYTDALRYSQLNPSSTARVAGLGGAFGAMGEDFASLSINPAGLASYRSSDFMFTPSIQLNETRSSLGESALETSKTKFGINNLGIIFSNEPSSVDWASSNFAFGFNKLANFNQEFLYAGSTEGSITERFLDLANDPNTAFFNPFEDGLANEVTAIYFDNDLGQYVSDFSPEDIVSKTQNVRRSGYVSEMTFAWAGALENRKFSFGASLGFPFVSFEERKTYQESDPSDDITFFNELTFQENVKTTGAGVNFKLGLIFAPFKNIRLGASVHSPNWYSLTEEFDTSLAYSFTDANGTSDTTALSPSGFFEYELRSPWRYTVSIGSLFKSGNLRGLVNLDIEYLNYADNKFNLTSDSDDLEDAIYEQSLNNDIRIDFTQATNIRLGAELGYNVLRFRAGLGLEGSPYDLDQGEFNKVLSLGFGLKQSIFYLDFAMQLREVDTGYFPYVLNDELRNQLVQNNSTVNNYVLTCGFRF